jgi:hypothetical protein
MNNLNIKGKLKLLIAYNVGEVLGLVLNHLGERTPLVNEVIMMIARYNDLNRDAEHRRLDREGVAVEMNKIRLSIIELIDLAGPDELPLEPVAHALLNEDRFRGIIEKKETRETFRGLFDETEIVIESLEFLPEAYARFGTGLSGAQQLWNALQLLQLRLGLQPEPGPAPESESDMASVWMHLRDQAGLLSAKADLWPSDLHEALRQALRDA